MPASRRPRPRAARAARVAHALAAGLAALVLAAGCGASPSASVGAETRDARATPQDASASPSPGTPTPTVASSPPTSPASTPSAARGTALAQLALLTVRGRAQMTGYDRDRFGQAWLDADRNGCDTRNDVLGRDVTAKTFKPGTRDCVVLSGRLPDPYTARTIDFVRGDGDGVDIDHVVALGDAWASGAGRWDIHERAALANDPLNLLAVDLHTNRQKGDSDAASWLPPARSYRCAYVARQVAVKAKYRLSVTPAEKAAVERVLDRCADQRAIADPTDAPTRVDQDLTDPGPSPSRAAAPTTAASPRRATGGGPVSYDNCDAVRAAGAAPIHRGDPGYSRSLDRDGDGTGCE